MRPPPRIPIERCGVFTSAEAIAAGWTPDSLARAVRRGELVRWRRGICSSAWGPDSPVAPVRRPDVDLARTAVAAALTTPAAVVGNLAAAAAYGWPVWAPKPRACVVVDDGRTRVPGLHVHRTPLGDDAVSVAGYRLTRPVRTVLDVACEHGTEAGLVVADAALARGAITAEKLGAAVAAAAGRTGIAAARRMAELADHRAESPLESRSRWHCLVHGLPPPEPQVLLYDLDGVFLGRVDLFWELGVVGEVDGTDKLMDAGARRALLAWHGRLHRAGLRIVRWGAPDLRTFGSTAAWVRAELAAAAADPRAPRWRAVPT